MKKSFETILLLSASLVAGALHAPAQLMPQDAWYFSHRFGVEDVGPSPLIAISPLNEICVGEGVFDFDGVRNGGNWYGSQFPVRFSSDRYVLSGYDGVQVFDLNGQHIMSISRENDYWILGAALGPDNRVYIAERRDPPEDCRIRVCETNGVTLSVWGSSGTLEGQFGDWIEEIAVGPDSRVYVGTDYRLKVYEADGSYIETLNFNHFGFHISYDGCLYGEAYNNGWSYCPAGSDSKFRFDYATTGTLSGIAIGPDHRIAALVTYGGSWGPYSVEILNPTFRTANYTNAIPCPRLVRCEQRPGTPSLDITYRIDDRDSPTVTVAVNAFSGGGYSLGNFVKMNTFLDNTQTNLGAGIAANEERLLSWNVAADLDVEQYAYLNINVMAQDERGLMDMDYVTFPSNETQSALTISRLPFASGDYLPLWFWWLATDDPGINLVSGAVHGVGGAWDGLVLAQGEGTTTDGQEFIIDRLGLRWATVDELARAGSSSNAVPRFTIGPGMRPDWVNEFGWAGGNVVKE